MEQPKPKFPINGTITICYIRVPPKVKTKDGLMKCFWLEGKKISCTIIKNVHIKCTHTHQVFAYFNTYRYIYYTWMASKIDKKLALIAADFLTLKNQNRSLPRCCSCYFYACAANIYKYMRQKSKLEFLFNIIVCF